MMAIMAMMNDHDNYNDNDRHDEDHDDHDGSVFTEQLYVVIIIWRDTIFVLLINKKSYLVIKVFRPIFHGS